MARFRHELRAFLAVSDDAAAAAGVTLQQFQLLLAIRGRAEPDPPSIADLADTLRLRHHSAVELVQRAHRAGLVDVGSDPADGRRQLVTITAAGAGALRAVYTEHGLELGTYRAQMREVLRQLDD